MRKGNTLRLEGSECLYKVYDLSLVGEIGPREGVKARRTMGNLLGLLPSPGRDLSMKRDIRLCVHCVLESSGHQPPVTSLVS